ncbi:MAG TPA: hypothetical protein VEC35_03760 [Noviherbaspirillum sp.]|nr:hypothetical protein [Noviherbaspirillum sp.]
MTSIERILDKGSCYARFRIAILVTQEVLASAPAAAGTDMLERAAGCSAWLLGRVCANLEHTGILMRATGVRDAWLPGPLAANVTLADILCSQIGDQAGRQGKTTRPRMSTLAVRRDMEAFVLQATMNINQTVIEQLRRFPLRKAACNLPAVHDA